MVLGERHRVGQLGEEIGGDLEGLVDVVARYGRFGGRTGGGDTRAMVLGSRGLDGLSEALGRSSPAILASGTRILVVAKEEEVAKNLQPMVDMATMRRVSNEDGYRRFLMSCVGAVIG